MPNKWPEKVEKRPYLNLNFQAFFFQNWKTQISKQIVVYVVAFDANKILTYLNSQNDCQILSFVKDNYVVVKKMTRNGRKKPN